MSIQFSTNLPVPVLVQAILPKWDPEDVFSGGAPEVVECSLGGVQILHLLDEKAREALDAALETFMIEGHSPV